MNRLPLADFAAVCLVDPPPLPAESWQSLVDYAEAGGGVGIFLGRMRARNEMNQADAQQLLPAKLRWHSHETTYLRPVAVEHPALAELRELADTVPWSEFPVFKYWELEAGERDAHVVATFANGKPALVERQIGTGRVLMMTTPVSDPAYDDPWNLLPTGPDPWPFLALANGVAIPGRRGRRAAQLLRRPNRRPAADAGGASLELRAADAVRSDSRTSAVRQSLAPGQQDCRSRRPKRWATTGFAPAAQDGRLDRGFSVNLPAEISRLERAVPAEIVEALGSKRTRIARTREEIEVRVGLGRVGRELFPALIIAVALVLAAEQLLANRFYSSAGAASRAAQEDIGLRIADFGLKNVLQSAIRKSKQSEIPSSPS